MIIEGSTHDNAGHLARYLLRAKPDEKEVIFELRDAASDNLRAALTDWELCGRSLTKGQKILFHSYIRLPRNEALQEAQWFGVIERLEEKLGLGNCPRAVIGHNGADGLHVHVAWSRLDAQTEKLAPLHHSRRAFHEVARWAEAEYKLSPVNSAPPTKRKKRKMSDREIRAFKDRGLQREMLQKIMRAAWKATESGTEMQAMLRSLGCEIEPGDRRSFVVNYHGLKVNPVRMLDGVREADFLERMKDVDFSAVEGERQTKRRCAAYTMAGELDQQLAANDQKPPRGFTRKRRALTPRLRPKLWYGDPGI